jgi:tetratricopeptide (TPR) repeat protein
MVIPVLFFAAALTVKQDQTPLRSGCDAADEIVTSLSSGTPVEVRFRLADGSDCFKVSATVGGKSVIGYLPASALTGVDVFDKDHSSAASVGTSLETSQALKPVEAETKSLVARAVDPAIGRAADLIEANQPAQALATLEPTLKRYPRDPDVLLVAGLAAYRADQLRTALDYWKQSLDLAPNDALSRLYAKVLREKENDRSGDKLFGLRFALRYEGETLPAETARAIVAVLDEEFNRVASQIGCRTDERIVAIVQSRDAYFRTTGAAEWSGGQYDGRIHIALTEGNLGAETRRKLAHELVHACLTNLGTVWPAWLQEGLAQKMSGDVLSSGTREQLKKLAEAHQIPRLENLGQNWSRLSSDNARVAYSLALAAAEALYDNYSSYGLRNILNNPQTLQQITMELDKRLGF